MVQLNFQGQTLQILNKPKNLRKYDRVLEMCRQMTSHCATTYSRDERHFPVNCLLAHFYMFWWSNFIFNVLVSVILLYNMIHFNVLVINILSHCVILEQKPSKNCLEDDADDRYIMIYFNFLLNLRHSENFLHFNIFWCADWTLVVIL